MIWFGFLLFFVVFVVDFLIIDFFSCSFFIILFFLSFLVPLDVRFVLDWITVVRTVSVDSSSAPDSFILLTIDVLVGFDFVVYFSTPASQDELSVTHLFSSLPLLLLHQRLRTQALRHGTSSMSFLGVKMSIMTLGLLTWLCGVGQL